MHVVILTFGLTALTLGVSGYPLSRTSMEGNTAMTSRDILAAVPQVETIATRNDFEEAPLVRREISLYGDGGRGIGVSAGSIDPNPDQNSGRLVAPQPVTPTPNLQPVTPNPNPQPVIIPVSPPITPPVTNDQGTSTGQEIDVVPQLPVNPNVSANRQIRLLACMHWFYGIGGTKPYWCDGSSPGIAPGF